MHIHVVYLEICFIIRGKFTVHWINAIIVCIFQSEWCSWHVLRRPLCNQAYSQWSAWQLELLHTVVYIGKRRQGHAIICWTVSGFQFDKGIAENVRVGMNVIRRPFSLHRCTNYLKWVNSKRAGSTTVPPHVNMLAGFNEFY